MNTPKNFALQLGALITLYASIGSLTALLFSVITIIFPDEADDIYAAEGAAQTIRFGIASLIVVFPVYLWLTRTVNQIRRKEEGKYLNLTKWLIYLSLLVGGGVIVGDLIAVINGFLSGELTIRFALKAAILGIVIVAAFYYYLKDAQGHWQKHEKGSVLLGLGTTAVVCAALVAGYMHSETPQEVREAKIDDNQVADLQNMQWRIEDYYRVNQALPATLDVAFIGFEIPAAPEGRSEYQYEVVDEANYKLCATFATDSAASELTKPVPVHDRNYNWAHGEGEWCYERVIDNKNTEIID